MPSFWRRLRFFTLESPAGKTLVTVLTTVLAGVLSGTFVTEITVDSALNWILFYKAKSFYALGALTIFSYWHTRAVYLIERDVSKFADREYCIAYIRSQCLPDLAEQVRQQLRQGHGGQFERAMDELRRSLQ